MMKGPARSTLILAVSSLVIVLLPSALISLGVIDAYLAQVITIGGVNAILAVSVNMITGITGQLSIGQAGFMAIGAYATIFFNLDAGLPLPLAALIAALVTAFTGFLIGFPTLKLSGDYLAIVTLGFGEIIRVILVNLRPLTGGANGRQFTTPLAVYSDLSFFTVTAALVTLLLLLRNFMRSSYGRAILAVREDEIAANAAGIHIFRYKMIGFVTASFIAGLGGGLFAMVIGFVKPDVASFNKSIDYLIFVVLGGMGSLTGSVLAAYVLTYLQEFLRFLQDYRLLIYPFLLIFVMLFRPQGLIGMKEISIARLLGRAARFYRARKEAGRGK